MAATPPSAVPDAARTAGNDAGGDPARQPSGLLLLVVGAAISILVTNLYVAQPLVADIGRDLGMSPGVSGAVISASQFGYGFGLFLVAPLCDMVENRRLVLVTGTVALAGTIGLATLTSAPLFLACALIVGVFSSGAQILLPYLTHILPPANLGRGLGAIMAGVLFSVMLARPFALFVTGTLGWRAIYWILAAATLVAGVVLARIMPPRQPALRSSYLRTIGSMAGLLWHERKVVRRTVYQALLFGVFTMFWAVTPMMLGMEFHLDHIAIALFALAGVGGALAAPLAGIAADRGYSRVGTVLACIVIGLAWMGTVPAVMWLAIAPLVVVAIAIDGSIQATQTFSRLIVLEVAPERRGRVNALYMTIVYMSGACGSIAGVALYVARGWPAVAGAGAAIALAVAVAEALDRGRPAGYPPR